MKVHVPASDRLHITVAALIVAASAYAGIDIATDARTEPYSLLTAGPACLGAADQESEIYFVGCGGFL